MDRRVFRNFAAGVMRNGGAAFGHLRAHRNWTGAALEARLSKIRSGDGDRDHGWGSLFLSTRLSGNSEGASAC